MAKEKPVEVLEGVDKLKAMAKSFSSYINTQYKGRVSYTPDANTKASLSVSKWLELPQHLQDGLGIKGFPFGLITQVYGKKDSGKTSILMQGIAAAQKQGVLPILILTEYKFDFGRLQQFMGADPEALIVLEADDLETGFGYLEKILRDLKNGTITLEKSDGSETSIDVSNQPCFIFWDSIGGTLSKTEAEGEVEDWSKDMGRGAQAVKKLVKRSAQLLNKVKDKVGLLFLNQVWTARTPTGIAYDKPAGGEAVQHYYALEIHLKKGTDIKMTVKGQDMSVGYNITANVIKNHITHSRLSSQFIAVAEGLLPVAELEAFKKRYRSLKESE